MKGASATGKHEILRLWLFNKINSLCRREYSNVEQYPVRRRA
nr:MAG TPA: hypothetical protein [Caudoviricetes sp.]